MKKYIVLLLLIFLTGCSVVRIDTSDIDNVIDIVLSKNNKLYNEEGIGYQYYIPRGVTHIETDEQMEKLYCNGVYYYLYIDTVSYYYHQHTRYTHDKGLYYDKKIDNGKDGYIKIKKIDKMYHVEFYYNYAKIETVVPKAKLNSTVLNATYILSTVKFNKKIVKLMLDDEYFTNKTGKYKLFDNSTKSNKFELKVEEEK